jgi:eukaryotic-like serine/threonine-protein kinase
MSDLETLLDIEVKAGMVLAGRLKLEEKTASGVFGEVYRATDESTGNQVAVKVSAPTDRGEAWLYYWHEEEIPSLRQEAGRYHDCQHVVSTFYLEHTEDGEEGVLPLVVMPYYEKNLQQVVDTKKLNVDQILRYSRDVAYGLRELHTKESAAHGDLKLDNIMVDGLGRCLIGDKGLRRKILRYGDRRDGEAPKHLVGHRYIRAPELFNKEEIDERSDIWSFGSCLYKLFTGKYVFQDEVEENERFFEGMESAEYYERLNKKLKTAPRRYKNLLQTCLAFHSFSRYDSNELEEAIREQ